MGSYTHLSVSDRRRFYTLLEMGLRISDIAKRLSKHCLTLSGELNHNSGPDEYLAQTAHLKAEERAKQKRLCKLQTDGVLRNYVIKGLKKGWSPEKISGRIKLNKLTFYLCHDTIYQFIYRSKNKEIY